MRYAPNCWIIYTAKDARTWYSRVKPLLEKGDRVLICELNTENKQGWLENWMWKWLNKARE